MNILVGVMVFLVCFQTAMVICLFYLWLREHRWRLMEAELTAGLAQELSEVSMARRERMRWYWPKAPRISW